MIFLQVFMAIECLKTQTLRIPEHLNDFLIFNDYLWFNKTVYSYGRTFSAVNY